MPVHAWRWRLEPDACCLSDLQRERCARGADRVGGGDGEGVLASASLRRCSGDIRRPLPVSVNVRPLGSGPDKVMAGTGYPAAMMTKIMGASTLGAAPEITLIAGRLVTVRVNAWVAVPAVLLAVRVSRYGPAASRRGVPEMVQLAAPVVVQVRPPGDALAV